MKFPRRIDANKARQTTRIVFGIYVELERRYKLYNIGYDNTHNTRTVVYYRFWSSRSQYNTMIFYMGTNILYNARYIDITVRIAISPFILVHRAPRVVYYSSKFDSKYPHCNDTKTRTRWALTFYFRVLNTCAGT